MNRVAETGSRAIVAFGVGDKPKRRLRKSGAQARASIRGG
jgi:hypothetical protein